MSHMTQTANPVTLLASPLGEEGHEVAKGWTVVILIMILDVDVTAERRLCDSSPAVNGKKQSVSFEGPGPAPAPGRSVSFAFIG